MKQTKNTGPSGEMKRKAKWRVRISIKSQIPYYVLTH